jgi:membrane protein
MLISVVLAVELLYFIGPNVKQRFWATLPGALLAVGVWIAASYGLGLYFAHFSNYNKTYGSIGAVMALMLWLWVTSLTILVGAELNSELLKAAGARLKGQAHTDNPQNIKKPPPAAE